MIVCTKNSNSNVICAYIYEGYRRLYAASVDKDGNIPSFEAIRHDCVIHEKYNACNVMIINYNDYYCDKDVFKDIIRELLDERYTFDINKPRSYKLKQYERKSIEMSLELGCSPNTSLEGFKRLHKNDLNKSFFDNLT